MTHSLMSCSSSSGVDRLPLTRFGKEFFSHTLLPREVSQLFKEQDWWRCAFVQENKAADVSLLVSRVVYQLCLSQDGKIYSLKTAYHAIASRWSVKSFKERSYIATCPFLKEIFIRVVDRNVTIDLLMAQIGRGGIKAAFRASSFCFDWKNRQWKRLPPVVYSFPFTPSRGPIEGAFVHKQAVEEVRDVSLYIAEPVELVETYVFRQKLYAGNLSNLLQGFLPLAHVMGFRGQGPYFSLACEFVQKIGTALEVLHRLGYVHADVKSGNIFINFQDGQLSPALADWDIAGVSGDQEPPHPYPYWDILCSSVGLKTPYTDRYGVALLCLEIIFFDKFSSSPDWPVSLMRIREAINRHYLARTLAPADYYSEDFFGTAYHNTLSRTQKETWNIFYAACCQSSYARYQILERLTGTLKERTIAVLEIEAAEVSRRKWVCNIPWMMAHFQWAVLGLGASRSSMTEGKMYLHFQRLQPW